MLPEKALIRGEYLCNYYHHILECPCQFPVCCTLNTFIVFCYRTESLDEDGNAPKKKIRATPRRRSGAHTPANPPSPADPGPSPRLEAPRDFMVSRERLLWEDPSTVVGLQVG